MFIGSTTPLDDGDSWESGPRQVDRSDRITGIVKTDQAGTLYIEQSADGVNWDLSVSNSIVAGTGESFSEELYAPYVQLRFHNTGSDQTYFRIAGKTSSAGDS
jgi:hypothetical protein